MKRRTYRGPTKPADARPGMFTRAVKTQTTDVDPDYRSAAEPMPRSRIEEMVKQHRKRQGKRE